MRGAYGINPDSTRKRAAAALCRRNCGVAPGYWVIKHDAHFYDGEKAGLGKMMIGIMIDLAVGLLCIILGFLLWRKQKISLLHRYHYKNVKKEDVPAYTRQMGIGLILIGAGICMTGLLHLVDSSLWWISESAGFVLGLLVMHRAQKRYNGSWFS